MSRTSAWDSSGRCPTISWAASVWASASDLPWHCKRHQQSLPLSRRKGFVNATGSAIDSATPRATREAILRAIVRATARATWRATGTATRSAAVRATGRATGIATRTATGGATGQVAEHVPRGTAVEITPRTMYGATLSATPSTTR